MRGRVVLFLVFVILAVIAFILAPRAGDWAFAASEKPNVGMAALGGVLFGVLSVLFVFGLGLLLSILAVYVMFGGKWASLLTLSIVVLGSTSFGIYEIRKKELGGLCFATLVASFSVAGMEKLFRRPSARPKESPSS